MRSNVITDTGAVTELSRTFIDSAHNHVTKNVIYLISSFLGDIRVDFD